MDNVRFALISAVGVVLFFMWQAWQTDYPTTPPAATAQVQTQQSAPSSDAHASDALDSDDVPDISSAPQAAEAGAQEDKSTQPSVAAAADQGSDVDTGQRIHVITDKLDLYIDTRGGDIREARLIGVPSSDAHPDQNLQLLNDKAPNFFIVQSGLIGQGSVPDHRDLFKSARTVYQLGKDQDSIDVPLTWQSGDHLVTKTYTFYRDSYRIGLRHTVVNHSDKTWKISPYLRFWRLPYEGVDKAKFSRSFMGVAWYQQKAGEKEYRFEKISAKDLGEDPLKAEQTGGWISLMQQYFLAAVIPPAGQKVSYFAKDKSVANSSQQGFTAGYVGQTQDIAPGNTGETSAELYIGPKLKNRLEAAAPGLDLTIDYGFLAVIAKPIFWFMNELHSIFGNWGVAIILLTVSIKLVFYKLSETQYRAMARMRKFGPRIKQIKEQYGDDKEQLQAKMMGLYKKEGFNPLGGCWPMLVQMPVFLSLYWVLLASVELRHAPFILWIHDLSSPDPYYILPALFGITMYAQQKLSSQTMTLDPMQAKMMQFMPVGMAVFFAFFPSGLVLYWFTNNLLSIAQQWYIYRKLDHEGLGRKASAK